MTDLGHDAKKYSLKLLGYRGRSEKELRERLKKKGFPENDISSTVMFLKETGFLDDRALALNLKRQAIKNRLLGYRGARNFMLKRGLSPDLVESLLRCDEDRELQNAKKLLDKKAGSMRNYLSVTEKKRLWNFLLRRGYSTETIRKLFRNYTINKEESL